MPQHINRVERRTFHGLVTRVTQRAIQFRPQDREEAELLNIGFPDDVAWIPRSVTYLGEEVDLGDTAIEVDRWWVDKQRA